jgi:hypothetical protein
MDQGEAPNPERRSNGALLCLLVGAALMAAAWFLGLGASMAALFSGGSAPALAGGIAALALAPVVAVGGGLLMAIAVVWILVRVFADSRDAHARERYRDVQR